MNSFPYPDPRAMCAGLATVVAVAATGCFADTSPLMVADDDDSDPSATDSITSTTGPSTTDGPAGDETSAGATTQGPGTTGTTTLGESTGDETSTGTGPGGSTGPAAQGCGDGIIDPTEDCDDQNADNNDGCLDTCKERPILWIPFDGDGTNVGWLGPAYSAQAGASESYVAGHDGQAVLFNGSTLTVGETADPLSMGFRYTVSLWFREDVDVNYPNGVRILDTRANPGGGFETYPGSQTRIFQCFSGVPDGSACVNFPYTRGVWHHLMYRCDGTNTVFPGGCDVEVFLDGIEVGTYEAEGNVVFAPTQLEDMELGSGSNFLMDDLRIYDTVFDAQGQCETVIEGTWAMGSCILPA